MQTIQAVFNSAPLYAALLIVGLALGERAGVPAVVPTTSRGAAHDDLASGSVARPSGGWWGAVTPLHWVALFALAALVHLAGDLPLHADDAHRHFWPLTDWRFHSPVSYWDRAHHGGVFSVIEAALGVVLCVMLWSRFHAAWVRALLVLAATVYVGVPLYFTLALGGS